MSGETSPAGVERPAAPGAESPANPGAERASPAGGERAANPRAESAAAADVEPGTGGRERAGLTPSQTVGPYLALGLHWEDGPRIAAEDAPAAIRISGQVLDGAGGPVPDAVVEVWQASPSGRFAHPDDPRGTAPEEFRGFGRCLTDDEGHFHFVTVKPGSLPAEDGRTEAPHLDVSVFARGLLTRLVTRMYFPDETEANADDPVLATLAPGERATLVAAPDAGGLRFDIHLQGERETAFFEL